MAQGSRRPAGHEQVLRLIVHAEPAVQGPGQLFPDLGQSGAGAIAVDLQGGGVVQDGMDGLVHRLRCGHRGVAQAEVIDMLLADLLGTPFGHSGDLENNVLFRQHICIAF